MEKHLDEQKENGFEEIAKWIEELKLQMAHFNV